MKRLRHVRPLSRAGFTLMEVVGALAVLSIAGLGLLTMLRENERNTRERTQEFTAEQIVRNEIERLRIAGPWGGPVTTSFTVDHTGARTPTGNYTVAITRVGTCNGGVFHRDTGYEGASPAGCPALRPTAVYTVQARFRVHGQTRSVVRTLSLGSSETTSSTWNSATAP
jgi:prepilin-type N-terminal cleavage/methylation domain-containing protein